MEEFRHAYANTRFQASGSGIHAFHACLRHKGLHSLFRRGVLCAFYACPHVSDLVALLLLSRND